MLTKFGIEGYWISSLLEIAFGSFHGIAFGDNTFIAE